MSLVKLAMRLAAVEALKGNTLVGKAVLDSEIGAIDLKPDGSLESEQEKRFVAVYTQGGELELPSHMPRAMLEGGTCELIFEVGITASMAMRNPDTGDAEIIEGIPATDAAFEFYLDVVGRQILEVLTTGSGIWAEIWRGLVHRVISVHRIRTDSAGQVRLAGHQIKLICEIAADPTPGHAHDPDGPFGQFMDAMAGSEDLGQQARAAVINTVLEGADAPDWAKIRAQLGLTENELLALGQGPLGADEDRKTPEAKSATADVEHVGETEITIGTE